MAKKTKSKKDNKKPNNKTKKNSKEGGKEDEQTSMPTATATATATETPSNDPVVNEFSQIGNSFDKQYMAIGDAISYSMMTLPLVSIQYITKKYIRIINKAADSYLAAIGINSRTPSMKSFDKEIKESVRLFKKYMQVIARTTGTIAKQGAQVGNTLTKDKELMTVMDKFMLSLKDVFGIYLKQFEKVTDQGLPMVKKQTQKYIDVIKNGASNAGKAGINAGMNALQAIPGLGQGLSLIRMIHAITMPAFVFQRKISALIMKTANDIIVILEKNQSDAMVGLDKTLSLIKSALDAQDIAARKVMDFTNEVKSKIEGTKGELNKISDKAISKVKNKIGNKLEDLESKLPDAPKAPKMPDAPKLPDAPKMPDAPKAPKVNQSAGYRRKKKKRRRRTKKKSLKKRHRRKSRRRTRRKSTRRRRK